MGRGIFLSGRRGSNSRHSAWKADALPTELLPQKKVIMKERAGDEVRTRDIQLGRLTLYQLSYSRLFFDGAKVKLFFVSTKQK